MGIVDRLMTGGMGCDGEKEKGKGVRHSLNVAMPAHEYKTYVVQNIFNGSIWRCLTVLTY